MSFIKNNNTFHWALTGLIASSFIAAFFYNGQTLFAASIAITLLFISLSICLLKTDFKLQLTTVSTLLLLLWLWLGLTISWSVIPYISTIHFWLFGSLPLAFIILTSSDRADDIWQKLFHILLVITLILCAYSIYQAIFLHQRPSATLLNTNSLAAILNLMLLVTAGHYLLSGINTKALRSTRIFYALIIFLCAYVLGLIHGRGALISLFIAFTILLLFARQHSKTRDLLSLTALIATGLLIANTQLEGSLLARFLPLLPSISDDGIHLLNITNSTSVGYDRFLIWQSGWELLKTVPLLGIGFGVFWQAYPMFRNPADSSGGFYVHNDYLQFLIEAGLPALLLIIILFIAIFHMYINAFKHSSNTHKIEMTALFSGLLTVAMHSMLTFNFYVLSTLILTGVILGRLHRLATLNSTTLSFRSWSPTTRFSKILIILICTLPVLYSVSFGTSDYYYYDAKKLASQGKLDLALSELNNSINIFPSGDNHYTATAQIHLHLLKSNTNTEQRNQLFQQALLLLLKAEKNNPLRPNIFTTRGDLYSVAIKINNPDALKKAQSEYQTALKLNPRYYKARMGLARLQIKIGKPDLAYKILEAGMSQHYHWANDSEITHYFLLLAQLRHLHGDIEGTQILATRIHYLLKKFTKIDSMDTVMQLIQHNPITASTL